MGQLKSLADDIKQNGENNLIYNRCFRTQTQRKLVHVVNFKTCGIPNPKLDGHVMQIFWLYIRSGYCLFQILALEPVYKPERVLLVANTHYYFHPSACHVRLIQNLISVRYIENILKQYGKKVDET